jgi:hypothetical protein
MLNLAFVATPSRMLDGLPRCRRYFDLLRQSVVSLEHSSSSEIAARAGLSVIAHIVSCTENVRKFFEIDDLNLASLS